MTADRRRALRQVTALTVVILLLLTLSGGRAPWATAQGGSPLPPGVDGSLYLPRYQEIKARFASCMDGASGAAAVQTCLSDAQGALALLLADIGNDVNKAHEDHEHDTSESGPVTPPTGETGPLDDVPQVPPNTNPPVDQVKGPSYEQRILVIASDGKEPQLGAIRQTLDHMGTPYDVVVSATEELTESMLFDGDHANYQAVILTNGEAGYNNGSSYVSGLSTDEWTRLHTFEAAFGIRQVTWYTWPNPNYGLTFPETERDTTSSPIDGKLTTEGKGVFPYLTSAPITVKNAYAYLAKPHSAATTPLITTSSGHALASIHNYPDGRQNLAVTFDSNEHLVHGHQVGYGLIEWVTKGRFVGERRIYMDPQVDDVFYPNDLWNVHDPSKMVESYRMSGNDLNLTYQWQRRQNGSSVTRDLKFTMVYNGEGTSGDAEYQPDSLTPAVQSLQSKFKWINHTWTHLNLNQVDYQSAYEELKLNLDIASQLGLSNFSGLNMVTPEISGLFNADAMKAAKDLGIRYTVGDTSRPELGTPPPNMAVPNPVEPSIMMIPRRPNNLFYNVSTPEQWVSEYNHLYRSFWGRNLSYQEILDRESDVLLQYVIKGELYPWMFHQANLRFFDGKRSLLTDLLDAVISKYKAKFKLPVLSPRQDSIARKIENRMAFADADVEVTFHKGSNVLRISAEDTAIVPLTGVTYGSSVESYGGRSTSYVKVPAGGVVTISLN